VIVEGDDLYGDGVNIAARIEALADAGGVLVSNTVHDQVRDRLPFVFEDLGEQQVKNIARPVRVYRVSDLGDAVKSPVAPALPLPDKPSIAVLPFANMSGDPEQEYFADGMVEEITTAISRLPWLFVIARNSSFTYKGKAVDVKQVARELGVRYVLEGSVRKAGNRVRITGQLIDTSTGAHIWAERFDGALDDIFELQDQVASGVVATIEPRIRLAEIERASRKPTERLDAYDLYLRALAEFHKLTLDGYRTCVGMLRRALEIDPHYAPAAGLVGWCRLRQRTLGAVTAEEVTEAVQLARQVIGSGKDDPDALWMAGTAVATLAGEHALGCNAIQRAVALNPNSALGWAVLGWVQALLNQADAAVEAVERATRLSPLDPLSYVFKFAFAWAHLVAGRYDEAVACIDRGLHDQPRWAAAIVLKIALCELLNRDDERCEWVERLLALTPDATISRLEAGMANVMSPEIRAIFAAGLRKSGLPEG
jgi:TolB-like protein